MKNYTFLIGLLISVNAFSQCTIIGSTKIKANETETYTIENDLAQCGDCHHWSINSENATLVGDAKQNIIKLKANKIGKSVLSISIITPQGMSQCNKNIEVLTIDDFEDSKTTSSNCDIAINDYKEVKYADGIVTFFPQNAENDYKFEWVTNYANGDQKTSKEKVPQFPYSKDNGISSVKLKMFSAKCVKYFTKTYESNYWFFFNTETK